MFCGLFWHPFHTRSHLDQLVEFHFQLNIHTFFSLSFIWALIVCHGEFLWFFSVWNVPLFIIMMFHWTRIDLQIKFDAPKQCKNWEKKNYFWFPWMDQNWLLHTRRISFSTQFKQDCQVDLWASISFDCIQIAQNKCTNVKEWVK